MNSDTQKIAVERLKRAGLRATKQRIGVLAVLQDENRPLSHLELLQKLADSRFDRVTLYRILAMLTEAMLVHQVQGLDGVWRFCSHDETCEGCPGGHPHLLCEECGTMTCLTGCKIPHFDVPDDFHVRHKQVVISGICARCSKSHKPSDD
ncbi:MAG: transcriptional repressor [Proteobacteria bacterium]|nr:transcriptional repressor [Pseudomonadota bacterium]